MKIRADFVTNSSSSSFTIINLTSKTLNQILEELHCKHFIKEISDFEQAFSVAETPAKTLVRIIEEIVSYDLDEEDYEKWIALKNAIKEHSEEINLDSVGTIESGDASSDSGGPDFRYSILKINKGVGTLKSLCVDDDYYGESNDTLKEWSIEHGYFDETVTPEDDEDSMLGAYYEDMYFNPPYREMIKSYPDVIVEEIDLRSDNKNN